MKKTKKGFSIGEVLVAMFILLFGIVSSIFLTARSIDQISDSRNAMIASALVQEGIELVRNVRDNSVTQQTCGSSNDERCTAFDDETGYGWPSLSSSGRVCSIDYTLQGANGSLNCQNPQDTLYLNKDANLYSHSSGGSYVGSPFQRRIFIKYDTTDGSSLPPVSEEGENKIVATVTSVVIWEKGTFPSNADGIDSVCKIGNDCAFAQTKLTSWINYGD